MGTAQVLMALTCCPGVRCGQLDGASTWDTPGGGERQEWSRSVPARMLPAGEQETRSFPGQTQIWISALSPLLSSQIADQGEPVASHSQFLLGLYNTKQTRLLF